MNISQNWLKELVPFRLTPDQFVERLTMVGLEVEQTEDLAKKYDKFVVGVVTERGKHPNADRLTLCTVDIGIETKKIVCGAPNIAAGQMVAVALVGAIIPHDQHDPDGNPFVLERAKIRGVDSDGMICSAHELGLGEDSEGIIVLDPKAKVGMPLAKHLGMTDVIYSIGITPNRADCLSHIGVAREVGALVGAKAALPPVKIKELSVPASKVASVKIRDARGCPRYCARVLRKVTIGPSPKWMQDRLTAVGVRPINNVVDVTNYVLMETGHPLHAFDYDRLAGHSIIIRCASNEERFATLDGKPRALTSETLMICDGDRPVAIAGVMGGANSEISDSTTNILIESAYFDPRSIRRTSKRLALSTEASYRFERGADIEMAAYAASRAAQLIQELCGAEVYKGVIDAYPQKRKSAVVNVRVSRINAVIGTNLKKTQVVSLLKKIQLDAKSSGKDVLSVRVPSFRSDVVEEIDVIEEVARIHGYNNIETRTRASIDFTSSVRADRLQSELRSLVIGSGFHEILAISLQDEVTMGLAGETPVKVLNPVSVDMSTLRTSLIPGVLRIVQYNRNHGSKDLRLFELGNVFQRRPDKTSDSLDAYPEEERFLMVLTGKHSPLGVGVSQRNVDLLDLKGEVEAVLGKFDLDKYRLIYYDTPNALTEPTVGVEINGTYAGFFGKVRKEILSKVGIDEDVYVCELTTSVISGGWTEQRTFTSLPKFPSVTRDLAFTLDQSLPQREVEHVIRGAGQPLLTSVTLFDVYTGQQAGEGKKSLAYALEFRAPDHTLTDAEADAVMIRIVEAVRQQCNGVLRG